MSKMTRSPYVHERQAEYWASKQIDDYLFDLQFEVITLPVPMHIEKLVPADFIFFHKKSSKLFGLQYKALYHNERDHWRISITQHQTLTLYPWIYYCLLEVKSQRQLRAALHLARFASPDFVYAPEIYPDNPFRFANYMRWAAFFNKLEQCTEGILVASEENLAEIIRAGTNDTVLQRFSDNAVDLFLVDFSSNHALHYSSFLAP